MRIPALMVLAPIATLVACPLAACAHAVIPDEELVNGQSKTAPKKTALKQDAGVVILPAPAPAPTGTPNSGPAPIACAASVNGTACFTCCQAANPKALPVLHRAWDDCVCHSPGACATTCAATYCNGIAPTAGDACDTCLEANDPTCSQQAEGACKASLDCKPLLMCEDAAKCNTKPQ